MPNYREVMDTQVKPSEGFKIIWVRDDSQSRARYSLMGARAIRLTKAEMNSPEKRRSRAGELHVTAEGEIKLGDAVAWEIPIERSMELLKEAQQKSHDMLHAQAEGGGEAGPYLANKPIFKMRRSKDIPNDGAPSSHKTKE